MKRPNGAGTVKKLSGNRRKPYAALLTLGWDPATGQRQTKYVGYYATYEEAELALAVYRADPLPKEDMTWQMLYAEWRAINSPSWSPQLTANYNSAWQYMAPLHTLKVAATRTGQLQRIIDTATYRPPHKKGEKPKPPVRAGRSTLEKIRSLMKQILDYALQNDIVDKNYADFVRLPKKERVEKEHFSDVEVEKIRQAAEAGVPFADCVYMMIKTGLRISEFLALDRFSVDLEENVLRGGLKTDAGRNRVVPIHPTSVPIVRSWLAKGGERLICQENGKGYSAKTFRERCYYPALQAAGVRLLNPHCTRHTFASQLAAKGVPPLEIQHLMGHTDYSFTADTYTHVDLEPLKKAVCQI
ncbi:MAG: site-specific integrase [Clostridiales bacterium]|nr:site-specific integrase [Clostridiales bacterium]